jgi:hypothetical protein
MQHSWQPIRQGLGTIIMLLVMHSPGRLGNKLFLFAHLIAFGIEHRRSIINLSFDPYEKYFLSIRQICLCPFPAYSAYSPIRSVVRSARQSHATRRGFPPHLRHMFLRIAWTLYHASNRSELHKVLQVITDENLTRHWDMSAHEFIDLASDKLVLMINGWLFRDWPALRKHDHAVRQFFVPVEAHMSQVSLIVGRARRGIDILVGVHIRRGDYRTFLEGRFFFEFEQYADILRKLTTLYKYNAEMNIGFLICSDEPVPVEPFRGLHIYFGSGHLIEDMYALAQCDLLVGPWSTFCGWASFYGSVPWYRIEDPRAELRPDCFRSIYDIWASE